MSNIPALEITDLVKIYPPKLQALAGINLKVEHGDFFALLGPNGAGKSTAIGIITSLVNKTSGSVKILGHDLDTNPLEVKAAIGLVPQEFNFNQFEKVIDIVINQAGYYGISRKLAKDRAKYYLTKLDLWHKRDAISRNLSGGMKRRLMIARALVHEPEILILDEPTAGVDIELRRSTWDFLTEINTKGKTIILTTHYLEEAESLCRGLAIINKGKILEATTVKNLISKLQRESIILDLNTALDATPKVDECEVILKDNFTLEINYSKKISLTKIFNTLKTLNIEVSSMRNKANRLEELFINLIKNNEV